MGLFTFLKRRREAREQEHRRRAGAHAAPIFPSASLGRSTRAEIDLADPLNPLSPWSQLTWIDQQSAAPEAAPSGHGHHRHHDAPSHTPSWDVAPSHTPSHDHGGHHHTTSYDLGPSQTPSYDAGSSYDSGGGFDGGGHHGG